MNQKSGQPIFYIFCPILIYYYDTHKKVPNFLFGCPLVHEPNVESSNWKISYMGSDAPIFLGQENRLYPDGSYFHVIILASISCSQ